jgi:hypothetical protein
MRFVPRSWTPAHFAFNMDEMSHQTWADAHKTVCFVPADFPGPSVHYLASRMGRHVTLIACIAADGGFLPPVQGFSLERIQICSQSKASLDLDIFDDGFRETLIPELNARRERLASQEPALLIRDNCALPTEAPTSIIFVRSIGLCQPGSPPHTPIREINSSCWIDAASAKRKLQKVNLPPDHILRILDGSTGAAAQTIVAICRNAGTALMRDDERVLRCRITPKTSYCLLGVPLADPFGRAGGRRLSECRPLSRADDIAVVSRRVAQRRGEPCSRYGLPTPPKLF